MKQFMKIAVAFAAVLVGVIAFAQTETGKLSRGEWAQLVGKSSDDVATLRDTMSKVPADQQTEFLAAVNKAVESKNSTQEMKASQYTKIANAAIAAADKSTKLDVMAEIFATVPVDYLPTVNESLSPRLGLTGASLEKVGKQIIEKTGQRTQGNNESGVRSTFALLTILRAGGNTDALRSSLVDSLPDANTKNLAQNTWISPAINDGNYEPMLGAVEASTSFRHETALRLVGQSLVDQVLADMNAEASSTETHTPGNDIASGTLLGVGIDSNVLAPDAGANRVPRNNPRLQTQFEHPRGYANQQF